jgi:hypothetical protein
MTSTTTIDKIKRLRSEAANLSGFHQMFADALEADKRCDKKGYGFGLDNRFTAFKVNTHFSSYKGYYGNSSCSNALTVDSDLVAPYIVRALNVHQEKIFATAALLMRDEAAELSAKAETELAALRDLLASAKANAE